jgi:hypothetical protein
MKAKMKMQSRIAALAVEANPDFEFWDGTSAYDPDRHWKLRVALGDGDYLIVVSQKLDGWAVVFWDVGLQSRALANPKDFNAMVCDTPQHVADEYHSSRRPHRLVLEAAKLLLSTAEMMGLNDE